LKDTNLIYGHLDRRRKKCKGTDKGKTKFSPEPKKGSREKNGKVSDTVSSPAWRCERGE